MHWRMILTWLTAAESCLRMSAMFPSRDNPLALVYPFFPRATKGLEEVGENENRAKITFVSFHVPGNSVIPTTRRCESWRNAQREKERRREEKRGSMINTSGFTTNDKTSDVKKLQERIKILFYINY